MGGHQPRSTEIRDCLLLISVASQSGWSVRRLIRTWNVLEKHSVVLLIFSANYPVAGYFRVILSSIIIRSSPLSSIMKWR